MGIVGVEDFPYYAYGRYPSGARRVPIYYSSYPGQWSGDYSPYYYNSVHGCNSSPLFVVEAPFAGDGNVARKRKQDGLKGEVMSSVEHNARNARVEDAFMSEATPSSSKPVLSPSISSSKATQATRSLETRQVHPAESKQSKQSSLSSAERSSSLPHVISIPVMSMDEGNDNIVSCAVMPQEGIKKLRKAMSVERAAVLIQARYRGTHVRNTLPLVQLRRIAKVKSQLAELDGKVSDADFINYARENSAARVKLTESVMNLLLQLDAIQGAHPTVREIRKLATKKVISLQGRVDALLSADASRVELSQFPMGTDQARGDDMNWEIVTATETSRDARTATPMDDVDEEEEARMRMAKRDPYQGNGDIGKSETGLEKMELDVMESEMIQVNKSAVDEVERSECEADGHHESRIEMTHEDGDQVEEVSLARTETIREAVHEDGDQVEEVSLPGAETIREAAHEDGEEVEEVSVARAEMIREVVDVNSVKVNTNDEGIVQSGNTSENSPQQRLQGNLLRPNDDLSGDDEGDVVHPLNEKGSLLPYSPRSPFDALECLDLPASNSDGERQSELQASRGTIKDELTRGTDDTQALLLKLSKENKSLKSLLITVMEWNQMQSTTMQELNHRLRKIESKVLPRIDRKSKSRRSRHSKSNNMML